jgi:leucyl/phenylalanyl-tRNA--protein transferase
MSSRRDDVQAVVACYARGFFPLYDPWGRFYWERLGTRAVIPINPDALRRARHLAVRRRSAKPFQLRHTSAVDQVIAHLRDERVKERTWVRTEVVHIYTTLHNAGFLRTVEAWHDGRLAGALLGLVLPGTFIAETMFGLLPDASKLCLCRLVEDCHAAGIGAIDVQTPHDHDEFGLPRQGTPHPCVRLGEQQVRLSAFMRGFSDRWKRSFDGGIDEWIAAARAVRNTPTLASVPGLPPRMVQQAARLLALPSVS